MFEACDNSPSDGKLNQDEAVACFDKNCEELCATSTDCYCAGLDTTDMIDVHDSNQSSDLNSEEWCAAWEAVINGNSELPDKPEDSTLPTGVCVSNNKDANGREIFDKDGYPWGCSSYEGYVFYCGKYDSEFFQANNMCCECGGGCIDGKRVIGSQVTDEACPETCTFSKEGC